MSGHIPLVFARLSPEEQIDRLAQLHNILRSRRSIRHFSPEPVPTHLIEESIRGPERMLALQFDARQAAQYKLSRLAIEGSEAGHL